MAQVDEMTEGIYRISSFEPESGLNVDQFLIEDEYPALIHTGMYPMYDSVRNAVGEIMDPSRLRYVIVPHFESDECGGMGRFLAEAPDAVLACSELGAMVNLMRWDYAGPVQGFRDGDTLELGEHRLRFMETSHVHHWDSMMVFEETTESLFPAEYPVRVVVDRIEEMNPC